MTDILLAVIGMFLVIMGGIAGLYFKLGRISQMGEDHNQRIDRLEDTVFDGRPCRDRSS